jgi:hypothetical protein
MYNELLSALELLESLGKALNLSRVPYLPISSHHIHSLLLIAL